MRVIALIVALAGAIGTVLMRTRLPPRPPGAFFYPQAFRIAPYSLYAFAAAVSLRTSIGEQKLIIQGFVINFFFFLTFIGTYANAQGLVTIAPYML